MKLTPLDIRKQDFSRGFRGFEEDEVRAFLETLADQWQDVADESRRLEERIRELELKLVHYQKVEGALQEALNTGKQTSKQAIENAEKKARAILEEAHRSAEQYKRESVDQKHSLNVDIAKLDARKSEIIARLRAFLQSELEMLAYFSKNDPIGVGSTGSVLVAPTPQPTPIPTPTPPQTSAEMPAQPTAASLPEVPTQTESYFENQIDLNPAPEMTPTPSTTQETKGVEVDLPSLDTGSAVTGDGVDFEADLSDVTPPEPPKENGKSYSAGIDEFGPMLSSELSDLAKEIYNGEDITAEALQSKSDSATIDPPAPAPAESNSPAAESTPSWNLDEISRKIVSDSSQQPKTQDVQSVTEDDIAKIRRILDNLK